MKRGSWFIVVPVVLGLLAAGARSKGACDKNQFFAAAKKGDSATVKKLLQAGCKVNDVQYADSKYMPLHFAAMEGHGRLARMLIAQGAPVDARASGGMSPLFLAAKYGKAGVAKLLLEKGANMFARDDNGFTVLHHAAGSGFKEVVQLLIDKGKATRVNFDVNVRVNGYTPLKMATFESQRLAKINRLKPGMDFAGIEALLRRQGGTK